jgi:membrane-bound lytic murein transglycosylase MltF/transposase-like protein
MEDNRQKPKRVFTPEQKYKIIKAIKQCSSIREGLIKYNISSSMYYKWKHQLAAEIKPSLPSDSPAPLHDATAPGEKPGKPKKLSVQEKEHIYSLCLGLAILVVVAMSYLTFRQPADKPTAPAGDVQKPAATEDGRKQPRGLILTSKEWTGDFDEMLEYRRIRILVPQSRTLYFHDKGRERGVTGDTVRDFERYLNKKYARKIGKRHLTVFIIPCTQDAMLTDVANGLGDIATGNITVTNERLKTVDFVAPEEVPRVSEVLVTGPKSPAVGVIDDLAGKTVHVRKASSYYESLLSLNMRFQKEKKPPVKIILVPDALEDEDLMEMLNAGLFEFLVVDNWMAKIWAQVLPMIKVREDIVLRSSGRIGWAIRKGSPKLEAEIRDFHRNYLKKQGIIESRLAQYQKRIKQINNPTGDAEWKRFEHTLAMFEKYGHKYQFDPLMLAAQGYQESGLDQNKRSHAGAIGIMQIMPKTGAFLRVGNVGETEPNIHAGVKYMDLLISRYFPDKNFSEQDRTLFAFASYNAGPQKISKMRKLAEKRGLDPNIWFHNVELVTAEKVGFQTTAYVRSIYKYYIAYKLTLKNTEEKRNAREQISPKKNLHSQ